MTTKFDRNEIDDSILPWYARPSVDLQRILPHYLVSALMYRLARSRMGIVKNTLINYVIEHYNVDMTQAREPDPSYYACFNDFFTRALRTDARPLLSATDALIMPVDGTVSQIGTIRKDRLLQAKKRDYSLLELLGGDEEWQSRFADGYFATLSMSLGDTHRVYMPIDGELVRMRHVPGRLFDINSITAKLVPRLLVRNERVICLFETPAGPMAVILIGALFVGGIETTWAGTVAPVSRRSDRWDYAEKPGPVRLARGAELGRFSLGSAVIVLFAPGRIDWNPSVRPGTTQRMGTQLGRVIDKAPTSMNTKMVGLDYSSLRGE